MGNNGANSYTPWWHIDPEHQLVRESVVEKEVSNVNIGTEYQRATIHAE